MNYSKKHNPFFEIDYSNKIVFFNDEFPIDSDLFDSTYRFVKLNNKILLDSLVEAYKIKSLPCVYLYGEKIYLDEKLKENISNVESLKDELMVKRIENIINSAKVVLFLKGSVEEPYCRFSKGLVSFLKDLEYDLDNIVYYDILMNEEMRERIKQYNQWPTYPQLFIDKKFIGGYDIVKQLFETGELKKLLC